MKNGQNVFYDLSASESLQEAVQDLLRDPVIRKALGGHVLHRFTEAWQIEWDRYRVLVHPWETEEFIGKF